MNMERFRPNTDEATPIFELAEKEPVNKYAEFDPLRDISEQGLDRLKQRWIFEGDTIHRVHMKLLFPEWFDADRAKLASNMQLALNGVAHNYASYRKYPNEPLRRDDLQRALDVTYTSRILYPEHPLSPIFPVEIMPTGGIDFGAQTLLKINMLFGAKYPGKKYLNRGWSEAWQNYLDDFYEKPANNDSWMDYADEVAAVRLIDNERFKKMDRQGQIEWFNLEANKQYFIEILNQSGEKEPSPINQILGKHGMQPGPEDYSDDEDDALHFLSSYQILVAHEAWLNDDGTLHINKFGPALYEPDDTPLPNRVKFDQ